MYHEIWIIPAAIAVAGGLVSIREPEPPLEAPVEAVGECYGVQELSQTGAKWLLVSEEHIVMAFPKYVGEFMGRDVFEDVSKVFTRIGNSWCVIDRGFRA